MDNKSISKAASGDQIVSSGPQGLYIIPEWITLEEEQEIVDFLCSNEWGYSDTKSRPTQYYGDRSYYKSHQANTKPLGLLEKYTSRLNILVPGTHLDQALVNLYYKGSGIGAHIDKEIKANSIIFGLSLTSDINIDWSLVSDSSVKKRMLIPARSLYMMTGDSASIWKHSVPQLKRVYYPNTKKYIDKPDGYCRVSITFRHFA